MVEELVIPIDYNYMDKIGEGGFGIVVKAEDFWGEEVAVKILNPSKIKEANAKRFVREIKIHNMLKHDNIVEIIDFNIEDNDNALYYSMPLANKNFSEKLFEYKEDNFRNMDDDIVAYYFEQILDAMEYAHSEGVIHRDLKPLNILVFYGDKLKISDFGLGKFINRDTAALTKTMVSVGTECYAAPEQYQEGNAKNVDERADIYSLGKILYEMITFDLPISIDNDKIAHSKFKLLINKATQYDKNKRYINITDMRRVFNLLNGENKSFKNFAREFTELNKEYLQTKDFNKIEKMVDILIENQNDYQLYVDNFMQLDKETLEEINEGYSIEFKIIVENYIKHIDESHTFSFTDSISIFLLKIIRIINDFAIYETIIDVMVRLAYNHNRFYVATEIAKFIASLGARNIEELVIISEVLERNKKETKWLKSYLASYKLHEIINGTLRDM